MWAINFSPFLDELEHNSRTAEGYEESNKDSFTECPAKVADYGESGHKG